MSSSPSRLLAGPSLAGLSLAGPSLSGLLLSGLLLAAALVGVAAPASAAPAVFPGIGRTATPAEIKAWDIDVRADLKGLPAGSGTVDQGQDIWEAKCASCHGVFGESNQVFSPLVGGTTAEDVQSGRVARLTDPAYPGRTTMMKVATVSTLWDYINRAMPWNAPKTLTHDEVYAVTAFLLNLANVVPADFVLSDRTMADAQARLPNRNGMTTDHGLWPGIGMGNGGKPDVTASACMSACGGVPVIRSSLPPHARNAHGNLAEQNRSVGAQHGLDTAREAGAARLPVAVVTGTATGTATRTAAGVATGAAAGVSAGVASPKQAAAAGPAPTALLNQNQCLSCHAVDRKIVGPAFRDIAARHKDMTDLAAYLKTRIQKGGSGVWGPIPMPPQAISGDDAETIAKWLVKSASHR